MSRLLGLNLDSFKKGTTDLDTLNSLSSDELSDDLVKALNKEGLVQKEIQVRGKNGQIYTRKQWVRASEVTAQPKTGSSPQTDSENKHNKFSNVEVKTTGEKFNLVGEELFKPGEGMDEDPDWSFSKDFCKKFGLSTRETLCYMWDEEFYGDSEDENFMKMKSDIMSHPDFKLTPNNELDLDMEYSTFTVNGQRGAVVDFGHGSSMWFLPKKMINA